VIRIKRSRDPLCALPDVNPIIELADVTTFPQGEQGKMRARQPGANSLKILPMFLRPELRNPGGIRTCVQDAERQAFDGEDGKQPWFGRAGVLQVASRCVRGSPTTQKQQERSAAPVACQKGGRSYGRGSRRSATGRTG
jgi:hypothetical protein